MLLVMVNGHGHRQNAHQDNLNDHQNLTNRLLKNEFDLEDVATIISCVHVVTLQCCNISMLHIT